MILEHGELWDEHLVDYVHDAVVCDHVRLKHMPTIDRDAFSHRGGHRVGRYIVQRVSACLDFSLPQWNLRDVRPHSEPLPLERFEEEAIEQVVCRIISRHDVILEHLGQLSRIREQVGLLVIGQAVKSGIRGNEDGEGTWPAEGLNKPGYRL